MTTATPRSLTLEEFLKLPETKPASEFRDFQKINHPIYSHYIFLLPPLPTPSKNCGLHDRSLNGHDITRRHLRFTCLSNG
ncbi:hypothetical protein CDG77_16615 [Nostoc sp. 'Peltigera membranacea cyanobiont' 213]|nr:hypothetical protein CDG77_16615 [Nostoc sp. 'Peltigera membranacea cyanobiont' 213]